MKKCTPIFRFQFSCSSVLLLVLVLPMIGCGQESTKTSLHDHEHEVPAHTPRSLADLGKKIRARVATLEKTPDDVSAVSELNDLISWSAEIAADTDISEERWIPIYELSESIRVSIEDDAQNWETQRCDQAIRLCQLTEDAWRSLAPNQRRERYLGHSHDHDHSHGDHGHSHGEDGHSHGEDGHSHGKDGHSHGEDGHSHDDEHSHDPKGQS